LKFLQPHRIDLPPLSGYDVELTSTDLSSIVNTNIIDHQPVWITATSSRSELMSLFALSMLILGAAGFVMFKRRKRPGTIVVANKLKVDATGIWNGESFHPFEPDQISLIRLLLKAEVDVQTGAIVDIISIPELDYTHKLRMKNQLIENTKLKLRAILNTTIDPIRVVRSRSDRRLRNYSIDKELFA
ncbi:MAG: hypothetical protein ACKORJ_06560, partial [Bacteroidota bacterium]